jgi:tRNA pseudouridine38-40 synthase
LLNACLPSGRRNLRFEIEYDGTNYAGWQIQNSSRPIVHSSEKKTIQGILEKTLRKILQEKVKVIGSGRTDAGVHALAQVANFKTKSRLPLANIQKALNSLLPEDISIKGISEAREDFHSRYSAKSKIYRYVISNSSAKSAFLNKWALQVPYKLNTRLMRQEAGVLSGRHDFRSFTASGSAAKTTTRTIRNISIKTLRSPLIFIDIEADGFLYNMARNITGTLVEIARGRFKRGSIKKILRAKDRKLAGPTAPARGLFLVKVNY